MSSEANITPPPPETPETVAELKRQKVQFSRARWFVTGLLRVAYRRWTRIAVRLFPEDSASERLAHKLHLPLPDQLNMNWVTEHLAVGGRVHPDDIHALALAGVTHVIDTRSEYCDDAEALFERVRHAGSVFIGRHTPEAVGDYVAGPNHVLPTGRRARFASGLSVLDFMKRTSFLSLDKAGLAAIGPAAVALAHAEGLPAHAKSVAIRLQP